MTVDHSEIDTPQNVAAEPPVATEEVLDVIRTISHGGSTYNPFDTNENSYPAREPANPNSSIAKSSMMTEASPEPEPNARNSTGESLKDYKGEDYYAEKYRRSNKLKYVLISLIIGIGVAFLCTLIGVVVLATSKRDKTPIASPTSPDVPRLFEIPSSPLEFVHIDGKSPEIAEAFADHSLYQTFYGVTYGGPGSSWQADSKQKRSTSHSEAQSLSPKNATELQHRVALDVALLSRVTSRLRIEHNENNMIERVIQALRDLSFRMQLTLSITPENWDQHKLEFMRVLRSYPIEFIEAVHIEQDNEKDYKGVFNVLEELTKFQDQYELHDFKTSIVDAQKTQPNPLILTGTPKTAIEWVNDDKARSVYTNLVTPSETSERARYMTSWVCGVVPKLEREIEWFWSIAFDDAELGLQNGIFTENRKAKPACLPRCGDY